MNKIKERPVNLDLLHMRMPITAIVSILHRITGVILILLLPYVIHLFELSLSSEQGFQQVQAQFNSLAGVIVIIVLIWLFCHHLCAGLRFLLIDIDIGVTKQRATQGAWLVHLGSFGLTLLLSTLVLM